MADTIDIFGKPVKKSTAGAVAIGGVIIIGLLVYRSKKNAAAAAAAAASSNQAPTTDQSQNALDPATGYPTGSVEDLAALQAEQGQYGYQYGGYGGGVGTGTVTGNPTAFTNNAQWAQAAEQFITGSSGGLGASDAVGNALGKYITGGELSPTQADIVNQAIAFEGYPPVSGPDGYPPAIRLAPVQPPPTGGSTKVTVPNVITMEQEEAFKVIQGAGLKVTGTHPIPGKILHVETESPKAGTKVDKNSTVHLVSK